MGGNEETKEHCVGTRHSFKHASGFCNQCDGCGNDHPLVVTIGEGGAESKGAGFLEDLQVPY